MTSISNQLIECHSMVKTLSEWYKKLFKSISSLKNRIMRIEQHLWELRLEYRIKERIEISDRVNIFLTAIIITEESAKFLLCINTDSMLRIGQQEIWREILHTSKGVINGIEKGIIEDNYQEIKREREDIKEAFNTKAINKQHIKEVKILKTIWKDKHNIIVRVDNSY